MNVSKGIGAGIAIAIACILYVNTTNPIVGAILFSLGLLLVRLNKLDLFTGKIQKLREGMSLYDLGEVLLWNIIGVIIVVMMTILFSIPLPRIEVVATSKFNMTIVEAFGRAIICGFLMTIATMKQTPLWISALAVFGFVVTGMNHCVANMFYYIFGHNWLWLAYIWFDIVGNIAGGLLATIGKERVPA